MLRHDQHQPILEGIEVQLAALAEMALRLDEAGVCRAPVPSDWSLAGLLSHQRHVLRFWVGNVIVGANLPVPWTDESPNEDWNPPMGASIASCVTELREEWSSMRKLLDTHPEGEPAAMADDDGSRPSVTWVLAHLLAEVARHAGQMDIVSEIHQSERSAGGT